MELRHLKYFQTVAEELNFRKAAARLFISQPPLSRQIKELEAELGVLLFDRSNKKVKLTAAGAYLKEKTDALMGELEMIKQALPQIATGAQGQLKIGYISSILHNQLSEIILHLGDSFPNIKTRLYEMITRQQIKSLEEGNLDVGFIRSPVNSKVLNVVPLFTEQLAILFPSTIKNKRKLVDFKDHPFIFFNEEFAPTFYSSVVSLCNQAGFYPDIMHEANNMHSIVRMVEKGLGISIVPSSIQGQYTEMKVNFIPIKSSFTEVVIAYHKDNQKPSIKAFIEISEQIYKH